MNFEVLLGHNPGPWTGDGNNTYLLPGRVPTLVDAGVGDPRHLDAIQQALDRHGGAPLAQVLVTHGHRDHASGAPAIVERWPGVACRKMPWPEADARVDVRWVPLADGDHLEAGDARLRVVHTPGHSPDHVCFLDESSGSLLCGDLALDSGTVVIPASRGGDLVAYLESLRLVLRLAPRQLLPGHGRLVDDPVGLLTRYLEHRRMRDRQILAALDRAGPDAGLDDLVDRVYGGLAEALVGAARETTLAHLLRLESMRRVSRHGERWTRRSDVP